MPETVPELVLLKGEVPIESAKNLQVLIRNLYAAGALAIKLDVEFKTGAGPSTGQVAGAMQNLLDIVKSEVEGNTAWTELLNEVLQTVQEPGETYAG